MRGTRSGRCSNSQRGGIIPAYAGNTLIRPPSSGMSRDHPRVCGEHGAFGAERAAGGGSSPRMRGTRKAGACGSDRTGIIPAYAGNTCSGLAWCRVQWDHPRVCGEHRCDHKTVDALTGSSPRMRGTQPERSNGYRFDGIIPAYAGNTNSVE